MSNENSREWLLENSALPLIEYMVGQRVEFLTNIYGQFFIHPGGWISDGVMCSGHVGEHGETFKEAVDNWVDAVVNLPEGKHWTSDSYPEARRFTVRKFDHGETIVIMPFKRDADG